MAVRCTWTCSRSSDPNRALQETFQQLQRKIGTRPLIGGVMYSTVDLDPGAIQRALARHSPVCKVIGATSCLGVGTPEGFQTGGPVLAGWWLFGTGVRWGTAFVPKGARDGETIGRQLVQEALNDAQLSPTEVRWMIIHGTPGKEEAILRGIYTVVDHSVPIIGGSAGDNDLSGQWHVWTTEHSGMDGVSLAVCDWPWRFGVSYYSGYTATQYKGTVTRVQGRVLYEIDGRPAAEVYNEWLSGQLDRYLQEGGNVLGVTTLQPLGVARGQSAGAPIYVLVHPERVLPDEGALTLFAEVYRGEEVVLMRSSQLSLVQRAQQVSERALSVGNMEPQDVIGGLLIYCAGCMLAIQDRVDEMLYRFEQAVAGAPFVAAFTFGEQGCVLPRQFDHGNLMVSTLLLSDRPV